MTSVQPQETPYAHTGYTATPIQDQDSSVQSYIPNSNLTRPEPLQPEIMAGLYCSYHASLYQEQARNAATESVHVDYQVTLPSLSVLGLLPPLAMMKRGLARRRRPVSLIGEGPGFLLQPLPRPDIYHKRQVSSGPPLPFGNMPGIQGAIPEASCVPNPVSSPSSRCVGGGYRDIPFSAKPVKQRSLRGAKSKSKVQKIASPTKSRDRRPLPTQRSAPGQGVTTSKACNKLPAYKAIRHREQCAHSFSCRLPGCHNDSFVGRAALEEHLFHAHVVLNRRGRFVCNVGYCHVLSNNGGSPFASTEKQDLIDHLYERRCMSVMQKDMHKILHPFDTDISTSTAGETPPPASVTAPVLAAPVLAAPVLVAPVLTAPAEDPVPTPRPILRKLAPKSPANSVYDDDDFEFEFENDDDDDDDDDQSAVYAAANTLACM
ncbi:hypothetical protein BGZ63DRAFT_439703 [Mariannaea sp. PMI_226]|nr:hypothetical protein BGZ63DRAFT_439703 [Mariannaea sp. PMI_226]